MKFRKILVGAALIAAPMVPAITAQAAWANLCTGATAVCVTPQNVSGFVDPVPRGQWTTELAVNNFGLYAYSDGTGVNDRVNSIRLRGTITVGGIQYNRACFYPNINQGGGALTSVAATHPGWFDNASIGLSSMKRVNGSHAYC